MYGLTSNITTWLIPSVNRSLRSNLSLLAGLALFLRIEASAAPLLTNGMVASVSPVATEAGLAVLKNGGNAVDATVAVALTLGVVDVDNSGIGGGCFMLIRRANGEVVAIDGRETAPAHASRDMYLRNGKADTDLSQTGALASGVPGSLAAYDYAVRQFGRKRLPDLLLPAANVADQGFVLSDDYARRLASVSHEMAAFPSSRSVFFRDGKSLRKGDLLRQPDLAASYRHIAQDGLDWFYRGPFAQAVQDWMSNNGGLLTSNDFASYQIRLREPIRSSYRGFEIVTFPPPSSGGVHLVQMLNILEQFKLDQLDATTRAHLFAETMKLAFADRAYWLGDPDFAPVPVGLTDKAYGAELAHRISLEKPLKVPTHGVPPDAQTRLFKQHTTHFSVADAEGNWVACTATVNTSFGSKVVVPGTGVVLNNQMDDFSVQPGVPNYFGLVGAEANAVAPGKRPLSSMTPTIVLKDGQPWIALGAAGGPRIITTVLTELVDMLDLGLTPDQAVRQPRIHHQWSPDELTVESGLPHEIQANLSKRGHTVKVVGSASVSQIVARTPDGAGFLGAADPRAGGSADGW